MSFHFWCFFTDLLFRREMEKQVLGEIDGDFTNRERESHDSQVTLIQLLCSAIKPKTTIEALNHLSQRMVLMLRSSYVREN